MLILQHIDRALDLYIIENNIICIVYQFTFGSMYVQLYSTKVSQYILF